MPWPLSQDYNEVIQSPSLCFSDPELRQGKPVLNPLGLPLPCSGNFADVYEIRGPAGQRWAVKCFTREVPGLRDRYRKIGEALQQAKLPFTVDFSYLEQGIRVRGQWYPALKMQWVEGFVLNDFVKSMLDRPQTLDLLCQIWLRLARRLREAGLGHCDLQHGNVLLVPGTKAASLSVKLIDYDGMWVPALAGQKSGELGHAAYQHPQRFRDGIYSPDVDRFSHLLTYTAIRAAAVGGRQLWDRFDTGDNLLFRREDFESPRSSALFQELVKVDDPTVKQLAQALAIASQKPLIQTPFLDELVSEGAVPSRVSVQAPAAQTGVKMPAGGRPGRRRRSLVWGAMVGLVTVAVAVGAGLWVSQPGSGTASTEMAVVRHLETTGAVGATTGESPRTARTPPPTNPGTATSPKKDTQPEKGTPPDPDPKKDPDLKKGPPPKEELKTEPKAEDAVIDLMPLIDPQKHAIRGAWKRKDGALWSDATNGAFLEIPWAPPLEYDFRVVFSRQEGNDAVNQLLSCSGHTFSWLLGGGSNTLSGFEFIGGKGFFENATTVRSKAWVINGQKHTSVLQVRKNGVAAFLDDKLVQEWKTDYKDTEIPSWYHLPRRLRLGLGTWKSPTAFYQAEIRIVNPEKTTLAAEPSAAAQAKAEKLIKELFQKDYAKGKPPDLLALADKLLEQAMTTASDPVSRYVLYREARDLTLQGGDPAMAVKIVGRMAREYALDRLEMQAAILEKAAGLANTEGSRKTLAETALGVCDNALNGDAFAAAERLLKVAEAAARDSKNEALAALVRQQKSRLEYLQKEYQAIPAAKKSLGQNPSDAQASLVVGKYLCLGKGDWQHGLPLLASGGAPKLRELARKDLAGPDTPAEQAVVGDGWWDLAEAEPEGSLTRAHLLGRCNYWYRPSVAGLTGLPRTKVEKRCADLGLNPAVWRPRQFVPLPLDRVATAISTRPMWDHHPNATLPLPSWGMQESFRVPFAVIDPKQGKVKNIIVLHGPVESFSRSMPRSVRLPCQSSAGIIHLLGGVSAWGFPTVRDPSVSLLVRLHYDNGMTEDHPLKNGVQLADFNAPIEVPESRLAYRIANKQVRYLTVEPRRPTPIGEIEFIKGKDNTSPVILGVTIEKPNWK